MYQQRVKNIQSDIFVKTRVALDLGLDELFNIPRTFYGLAESRDYQKRTVRRRFSDDIGVKAFNFHSSFFQKHLDQGLIRRQAIYVDGTLHVFKKQYSDEGETTENNFISKTRERYYTELKGPDVNTESEEYEIHPKRYIQKVTTM